MDTWIALLRGINVGGKNILPMAELVQVLESLGLRDVKTYIQSGNVVFRSSGEVPASLSVDIASTIETRHGFRPHVLIVSADQWKDAMESNPFPEAEAEPKTLHLFFMASAPTDPDLEGLAVARAPSERFHLTGRVLYLYAPQGIGRSKLAAKAEKLLRVPATARNWRTVQKLWEMAETA